MPVGIHSVTQQMELTDRPVLVARQEQRAGVAILAAVQRQPERARRQPLGPGAREVGGKVRGHQLHRRAQAMLHVNPVQHAAQPHHIRNLSVDDGDARQRRHRALPARPALPQGGLPVTHQPKRLVHHQEAEFRCSRRRPCAAFELQQAGQDE
ncbi:hypothetical protein ABNQ39_27210 [Azospirillum sp. A26]|uniref:hypothetical protein n=1 Tax=Azospirillum sp. A26 TaxID=3160607 RepID=UPI00366F8FCD